MIGYNEQCPLARVEKKHFTLARYLLTPRFQSSQVSIDFLYENVNAQCTI